MQTKQYQNQISKTTADVIFESAKNLSEKKTNFLSIFGYGPTQLDYIEDSATQFLKAANSYKLENNWSKAGLAYIKYANQCKLINELSNMPTMAHIDETNAYIDAANCYLKIDDSKFVDKAIKLLSKAIENYIEHANFDRAGKCYKQLSDIYIKHNMILEGINALTEANKLFNLNLNNILMHNETQNELAKLSSTYFIDPNIDNNIKNQIPNLQSSALIFEEIGKNMSKTKLGHYSAKTYFLNALICQLANDDIVYAKNKLDEYINFEYSFAQSKECNFINNLINALEKNDIDDYQYHCQSHDKISPLSSWQVSMLLHIKNLVFISDLNETADSNAEKTEENPEENPEEIDLC